MSTISSLLTALIFACFLQYRTDFSQAAARYSEAFWHLPEPKQQRPFTDLDSRKSSRITVDNLSIFSRCSFAFSAWLLLFLMGAEAVAVLDCAGRLGVAAASETASAVGSQFLSWSSVMVILFLSGLRNFL